MMHYRKGENIEQELTKDDIPFGDCLLKMPQNDFLWMHVRGGTKVHNVISYAKNALDKGEYRTVVWSGSGGGVVKTVSCAEILKRSYPLQQLTRMDQVTIEEHWVPLVDGLEPIVAKRKVPSLHILMSLDPIDENIGDVQKPNTTTEYWRCSSSSAQQQRQQRQVGQNSEGLRQRQHHQGQKQFLKEKPQSQDARQDQVKIMLRKEQRERQQRSQNPNRNRRELRHNDNDQQRQQRSKIKPSAELQKSAQTTKMEVTTSEAISASPTNIPNYIESMNH